jgi:hypothetical protein
VILFLLHRRHGPVPGTVGLHAGQPRLHLIQGGLAAVSAIQPQRARARSPRAPPLPRNRFSDLSPRVRGDRLLRGRAIEVRPPLLFPS